MVAKPAKGRGGKAVGVTCIRVLCMADGAPGAYGLPVTKSVVKASVFALVPVQTRLPFMGTVVVPIIMSQGSVLLIDAQCTVAGMPGVLGLPVAKPVGEP